MRGPWQFEDPACREVGTEVFYPDRGEVNLAARAKRICAGCIHKQECAEWGLYNEHLGIWGGLVENERRSLRKVLKIDLREPRSA